MASVSDILAKMQHAEALIAARRALDNEGANTVVLHKSLATYVAAKVGRIVVLAPSEATMLLDAAKRSGFDALGVQIVVGAIDAKLAVSLDEPSKAAASSKNQLLTNCLAWVTETLMSSLRGKSSIDVKLSVASYYLANKCGCTHPHAQTYKHLWGRSSEYYRG